LSTSTQRAMSELNLVQIYGDLAYQKVYDARKACKKVLSPLEIQIKPLKARDLKLAKAVRTASILELRL
jgi:hypothetical protein